MRTGAHMEVVYVWEEAPWSLKKSIFLAGPTPRSDRVKSWRPEALGILKRSGYDGVVFVPESRSGIRKGDYSDQVEWEEKHLHMADVILFWVPRNLWTMPAFTTNVEFGFWAQSGKVVFGAPPDKRKKRDHARNRYLRYYADKLGMPSHVSLEATIESALLKLTDGSVRTGGERDVPLHIWNTSRFQEWYAVQTSVGNRLEGARVVWVFHAGPNHDFIFFWALHVDVYITSENRHKTNEVVLSRPDIATIVMYRRAETLEDSDIVLIREFRSPASTSDGFVWENPGGSTFQQKDNPLALVVDECREETGLSVDASRLRKHESRQMVSTISAHRAHLFSVEVTEAEFEWLRSRNGIANGVEADTERTYVEIVKLRDILGASNVDWAMLGMILSVLVQE